MIACDCFGLCVFVGVCLRMCAYASVFVFSIASCYDCMCFVLCLRVYVCIGLLMIAYGCGCVVVCLCLFAYVCV